MHAHGRLVQLAHHRMHEVGGVFPCLGAEDHGHGRKTRLDAMTAGKHVQEGCVTRIGFGPEAQRLHLLDGSVVTRQVAEADLLRCRGIGRLRLFGNGRCGLLDGRRRGLGLALVGIDAQPIGRGRRNQLVFHRRKARAVVIDGLDGDLRRTRRHALGDTRQEIGHALHVIVRKAEVLQLLQRKLLQLAGVLRHGFGRQMGRQALENMLRHGPVLQIASMGPCLAQAGDGSGGRIGLVAGKILLEGGQIQAHRQAELPVFDRIPCHAQVFCRFSIHFVAPTGRCALFESCAHMLKPRWYSIRKTILRTDNCTTAHKNRQAAAVLRACPVPRCRHYP